jgi:hypothetical protein
MIFSVVALPSLPWVKVDESKVRTFWLNFSNTYLIQDRHFISLFKVLFLNGLSESEVEAHFRFVVLSK